MALAMADDGGTPTLYLRRSSAIRLCSVGYVTCTGLHRSLVGIHVAVGTPSILKGLSYLCTTLAIIGRIFRFSETCPKLLCLVYRVRRSILVPQPWKSQISIIGDRQVQRQVMPRMHAIEKAVCAVCASTTESMC